MDIRTALTRMNAKVLMKGESGPALVDKVRGKQIDDARSRLSNGLPATPTKIPVPAVGLTSGGVMVRPIEAMLRLSMVTALTVPDDVFSYYRHWGWLKYLGAFNHHGRPRRLSLDPGALAHVHGNQRRILSEDLGVGFGVLLGEHWCRAMGATGPIRAIDVDKALRDARGFPGLTQASNAQRQPDYLLQSSSPSDPSLVESRLLETKGTVNRSNALKQLSHATSQIASLLLDGTPLQGIAVSTVSTTRGLTYLAVDPEADIDPWRPQRESIDRARRAAPTTEEADGLLFVDKDQFLASAVVTSNAALADFAGLNDIAASWLPEDSILRTRDQQRQIDEVELAVGAFSGTVFSVSVPGDVGRLSVFQGISRDVEVALRSGDHEEVRQAQARFSETMSEGPAESSTGQESDREAIALSDEGALLRIAVEP